MIRSTQENSAPACRWLMAGVGALAVAGLFALELVVARTPGLSSNPVLVALFHKTLVVHVDLSVLVWFLAIACMMWSQEASRRVPIITIPYMERAAAASFTLGTILMAISVLDGRGEPLMSNYIPVLTSPIFFLGLALVMTGVLLEILFYLLHGKLKDGTDGQGADRAYGFGIYAAAIITLFSLFAFVWSYALVPPVIDGQQYYEVLFWGGGHILQFTHTQFMMIAWVILASVVLPRFTLPPRALTGLMTFGMIAVLVTPFAYIAYDIAGADFRQFFTSHMIILGGIAPGLLGLLIFIALIGSGKVQPEFRALKSSLLMSLLLFFYGGLIGLAIKGQDVTIPAHYHGAIVGVTLAFMGLAYAMLPLLGYQSQAHTKLAYWQPIIYAIGQVMHISGLAWSGGYGVLRKTPGALEGGFTAAKAAMGIMGLGGLFAIIGGLIFVIVMGRAMIGGRSTEQPQ